MKVVEFFERKPGGTTGVVWRAKDELGREVAVKFFNESITPFREEVVKHAGALAAIDHPNVIGIFGIEDLKRPDGGDDGVPEPALVMEHAPGQTLNDWLARRDLALGEVNDVIDGLLSGLEAFHRKKLAHGDLHGGNIHIFNGIVKIVDPIAHDPSFVLSTAAFREGERRDLHFVKGMLIDILRAGGSATEPFGVFCLLSSGESTIAELREHARTALRLGQSKQQPVQAATSFYRVCRQTQGSDNRIEWQELRKSVLRTLQPQLDHFAELHKKIPQDQQLANEVIASAIEHASSLMSMVVSSAEDETSTYSRDVFLLEELLHVNWSRSGQATYVSLPEGLFYCGHHFAGAACCLNMNVKTVFELARRPFAAKHHETEPLYQNKPLAGWPDLFEHNCAHGFEFLLKAFGKVGFLREAFATERAYTRGLVAYNLLLSAMEFVSMDGSGWSDPQSDNELYYPDAAPVFALAPASVIGDAYRLLFEEMEIQKGGLFAGAKLNKDAFIAFWPRWMRRSFRLLSGRRPFLGAEVSSKVFSAPPL